MRIRKLFSFLSLIMVLTLLVFVFALPALAYTAAAPVQPGVVEWFQFNLTLILSLALAISELMAVTPWFKGNGILDSVIKLLKYLLNIKKGRSAADNDTAGDAGE